MCFGATMLVDMSVSFHHRYFLCCLICSIYITFIFSLFRTRNAGPVYITPYMLRNGSHSSDRV